MGPRIATTTNGHLATDRHDDPVETREAVHGTDIVGLLVVVCVMAASCQDRDGARTTLLSTYLSTPVRHVFADQDFAGRLVDWAATKTPRVR